MESSPENVDPAGIATNSSSITTNEVTGEDRGVTQESILADVIKAREKEIHEKIGNFSSKIDSKLKDANGLRVGILQFGDDRNKSGKFVYVPLNFDFINFDGMQSILDALEIDEPDLVFSLSRNHGIVPPKTGEKRLKEWKEDFTNEGVKPFGLPNSPQNETNSKQHVHQVPETIHTENGFTGPMRMAGTNINSFDERSGIFQSPIRTPLVDAGTAYSESTKYFGANKKGENQSKSFDVAAFADPDDAEDSAHIRMIEGNVNNLFTAIAEFKKTLFLITKPFRGNTLSEIACQAAADSKQKTITLGLFHTDNQHPGGNFTVVKNVMGTSTEYELNLVEDAKRRSATEFYEAWDDRLDHSEGRFRMPVPSSIFELDCVAKGEVPQKAIRVDCNFTDYERRVYELNNHVQHIPGGLANECSHRLVFASSKQKKAFTKAFTQFFATGYFACGATDSEMITAARALRKGQPLFVIEGTGAVATITKKFIAKKDSIFSHRFRKSASIKIMENAYDPNLQIEVERFLSKAALVEGHTLLDANIGMFNNFNADAQFVIANRSGNEPQRRRHDISYIQEVKNEITKVMATAFHHNNEIGGEEKDMHAIELCDDLIRDIENAKDRYKFQAIAIQVLVRLIIILITTSTVLTVFCMGKDDLISFRVENEDGSGYEEELGEVQTFDIERRGWCKQGILFPLDRVGLILPIIAAALQALDKAFRPDAKFANLLLTQHHLESEKFLFRARIRIYSSFNKSRGHDFENARKTFMKRCNAIYAECVKTEVKEGTLNPHIFSGSTCASWFLGRIIPILKDIIAFSRCKPLNAVVEASQHAFFVPSNWFVKCFKSRERYEDWQGRQMREMLKEYREGEEDEDRDVEEQRLRAVKESVKKFGLTDEDGDTLTNLYALEQQETQKEKYSIISIDEYVTLRLIPTREKFKRSLPIFIFWRNVCQVLLIAFTAISTFLVAIDFEQYVPIALAAAAAADAFLSYFHLESRTPVLHAAESDLRQILLDIQGLDVLEKRLTSTKTHFIERAEAVIMSNYAFLAESALKFGQRHNDKDDEELEEKYQAAAEKLKKKKE